MQNIIEKIQQAIDSGLTCFGVRAMTANPVDQSVIDISEGAEIQSSYVWDDGTATDEELGGVSTIGLDVDLCDGEVDEEWFNKAVLMLSDYKETETTALVIVGGNHNVDAIHNDVNETVIDGAIVIAVL